MTTLPQTPKGAGQNMIALNVNEQKHWWQLEEVITMMIIIEIIIIIIVI